jgi:hypothetical protein
MNVRGTGCDGHRIETSQDWVQCNRPSGSVKDIKFLDLLAIGFFSGTMLYLVGSVKNRFSCRETHNENLISLKCCIQWLAS